MARGSGITGIQHVAVLTPHVEEAEEHYATLFHAETQFRTTTVAGEVVLIDRRHGWDAIHAAGVKVNMSYMQAGSLTLAVIDEAPGREGALGHVCLACTEQELKRIREAVRDLELREHRDAPGVFRFRDAFGVLWEATHAADVAHRPDRKLDLGTGQVT